MRTRDHRIKRVAKALLSSTAEASSTSTASPTPPTPASSTPTRSRQHLDHLIDQISAEIGVQGKESAGLVYRNAIPEADEIRLIRGRHEAPEADQPLRRIAKVDSVFFSGRGGVDGGVESGID